MNSNSHPPPRRAANTGSMLLTPQENDCLFGYLGRKCSVSLVFFSWLCLLGQSVSRCISSHTPWLNIQVYFTFIDMKLFMVSAQSPTLLSCDLYCVFSLFYLHISIFPWCICHIQLYNIHLKAQPDICTKKKKKKSIYESWKTLWMFMFLCSPVSCLWFLWSIIKLCQEM